MKLLQILLLIINLFLTLEIFGAGKSDTFSSSSSSSSSISLPSSSNSSVSSYNLDFEFLEGYKEVKEALKNPEVIAAIRNPREGFFKNIETNYPIIYKQITEIVDYLTLILFPFPDEPDFEKFEQLIKILTDNFKYQLGTDMHICIQDLIHHFFSISLIHWPLQNRIIVIQKFILKLIFKLNNVFGVFRSKEFFDKLHKYINSINYETNYFQFSTNIGITDEEILKKKFENLKRKELECADEINRYLQYVDNFNKISLESQKNLEKYFPEKGLIKIIHEYEELMSLEEFLKMEDEQKQLASSSSSSSSKAEPAKI